MAKTCSFVFLLQLIATAQSTFKLEIVQDKNGTEVPVSDTIRAFEGSNFSLTCRIKSDYSSEFNRNDVIWGKTNDSVPLDKFTNLQSLTKNDKQKLLTLLDFHTEARRIFFKPFASTFSGTYLCMNLDLNLITSVNINVTETQENTVDLLYDETNLDSSSDIRILVIMSVTLFLILFTWCMVIATFKIKGMLGRHRDSECDVQVLRNFNDSSLRSLFPYRDSRYLLSYDQVVKNGARSTPCMA